METQPLSSPVKGKDINGKDRTFQNYVEFTENYVNSHTDGQGYVELSVTWNKIPVGEDYTVTEQDVLRYHLVNVTGTENVTISKLQEPTKGVAPDKIFSVHANLKAKPTGTSITFENQKDDWGTTTADTSVRISFRKVASKTGFIPVSMFDTGISLKNREA